MADRSLFALVAPRLERAHRQRKLELAGEALARSLARSAELRLERLVSHRELQYLRAGAVGDRKYLAQRAGKLARARMELATAQATSRRLGA